MFCYMQVFYRIILTLSILCTIHVLCDQVTQSSPPSSSNNRHSHQLLGRKSTVTLPDAMRYECVCGLVTRDKHIPCADGRYGCNGKIHVTCIPALSELSDEALKEIDDFVCPLCEVGPTVRLTSHRSFLVSSKKTSYYMHAYIPYV